MATPLLLGTGRLTWRRAERMSDRYGFVYLLQRGDSLSAENEAPRAALVLPPESVGARGRLIAEVIETRTSTHLGDFFHGVYPETPTVGERIVLGEGTLGWLYENGVDQVGILPDDKRDTLRMDIRALYRAHEQTVRLVFEPKEEAVKLKADRRHS